MIRITTTLIALLSITACTTIGDGVYGSTRLSERAFAQIQVGVDDMDDVRGAIGGPAVSLSPVSASDVKDSWNNEMLTIQADFPETAALWKYDKQVFPASGGGEYREKAVILFNNDGVVIKKGFLNNK